MLPRGIWLNLDINLFLTQLSTNEPEFDENKVWNIIPQWFKNTWAGTYPSQPDIL